MIDEIEVSNLALIEHAAIEPCAGLTALTGETGAGKTALLESCKLLRGARAGKQIVRDGTESAQVSARIFIEGAGEGAPGAADGGALEGASDLQAAPAPLELVVQRTVSADGRSRCRLNGQMASAATLQEAVGARIDLCSQHDSQRLTQVATHLQLLDAFGDAEIAQPMQAYGAAFATWRAAAAKLDEVRAAQNASSAEIEQARFTLRQIDALDPAPGEYEDLSAALKKAEHAEAFAQATAGAYEAISGDGGALDGVNAAIYALDSATKYDEGLANVAQSVRDACFILEDASRELASMRGNFDFDPESLNAMQERFAHYQRLIRAFGVCAQDVLDARAAAEQRVQAVENSGEVLAKAQAAHDSALDALTQAAANLTKARKAQGKAFAKQVTEVMTQLMMGSASIEVSFEAMAPGKFTPQGADKVELLFKPTSAMAARPLARIASGGELSRVMLAIHAVMGEQDNASTIVFDEIDAGVGGATALALADVLAQLSLSHQVIVVTHLPQVAARAAKHYVVEKHEAAGVAQTTIKAVEGTARAEELARMLSGKITEASLAHAYELLN